MKTRSILFSFFLILSLPNPSYANTPCERLTSMTEPVRFHVNSQKLLSLQSEFLVFQSSATSSDLSLRSRYDHPRIQSMNVMVYSQTKRARTFSLLGLFARNYNPEHYIYTSYSPVQPELVRAIFAAMTAAVIQYQLGINLTLTSEDTQIPFIRLSGFMPHILLLIQSAEFANPDHTLQSVQNLK